MFFLLWWIGVVCQHAGETFELLCVGNDVPLSNVRQSPVRDGKYPTGFV